MLHVNEKSGSSIQELKQSLQVYIVSISWHCLTRVDFCHRWAFLKFQKQPPANSKPTLFSFTLPIHSALTGESSIPVVPEKGFHCLTWVKCPSLNQITVRIGRASIWNYGMGQAHLSHMDQRKIGIL